MRVRVQMRAQAVVVAARLENVERHATFAIIVRQFRVLFVEEQLEFAGRDFENGFVGRRVDLLLEIAQVGRLHFGRHMVPQQQRLLQI